MFHFRRPPNILPSPIAPPDKLPNLLPHDKRTIPDLTYQICFVGSIWDTAARISDYRAQIEKSIGLALADSGLNGILQQYFVRSGAATAASPIGQVLPRIWQSSYKPEDIRDWITNLIQSGATPGFPPGTDFTKFAVLFVLPPGAILYGIAASDGNSLAGLGAYHHFVDVRAGSGGSIQRVYYAVSVLSDGQNGSAKPYWMPWKNVCAALFHEVAEIRTNPDDHEPSPKEGWFVDVTCNLMTQEVGDLPLLAAMPKPFEAMIDYPIVNPIYPIQKIWSNAACGPEP